MGDYVFDNARRWTAAEHILHLSEATGLSFEAAGAVVRHYIDMGNIVLITLTELQAYELAKVVDA